MSAFPLPRLFFLLTLLIFTLAAALRAATLNVPTSPYPTIQAGINAATSGDTVLVADGTYTGPGNVDLDFGGKNITVASVNGAAKTIINCGGYSSSDGSGNHRGFYIHSGETQAAIRGFNVKNGYETYIKAIKASGEGGGICIINSSVTIQNCVVNANTADDYGGGIYNFNMNSQANIVVTGCTISGNTAHDGGGIDNSNYTSNNTISGTITLTNSTISGNMGFYDGAGVRNENYNFNNSITSNSSGTIIVTNCTINDNKIVYSNGTSGGVSNYDCNGTITMTGCVIDGNSATNSGGGVYNETTTSGSTFISVITLANCTVSGNDTSYEGGGVYNTDIDTDGIITLLGCTISGNTSAYLGGGVVNSIIASLANSKLKGTVALTNCVISGNTDTNNYGGSGIYNQASAMSYATSVDGIIAINNCTISGNKASQSGACVTSQIYDFTGTVALTDCILYGNIVVSPNTNQTTDIEVDNSNSESLPTFSHCDVHGGYSGTGNISADPLFVNTASNDFHIKAGSPCRGTGTANGAPTTDKDGVIRPDPPSIGAYEVASARFDFNQDGHNDLLWHNTQTGQVLTWNMNDQSVLTYGSAFATVANTKWNVEAVADVNGDGIPDLLWRNSQTGQVLFWLMGANGTTVTSYGNPFATVSDTHWHIVSLADMNGDGHPDILWENSQTGQLLVWYMNGT